VEWVWQRKSWDEVKIPLFHHRAEAYRCLGQRLSDSSLIAQDETIATLVAVALLDAAMWEVRLEYTILICPLQT
jgi:hypothetical protein